MGSATGVIRFEFNGTGGKLFGRLFVGLLLSMITLNFYYPWFLCSLLRDLMADTRLKRGGKGPVQLAFDGQGGELFGKLIGGGILCSLTCSIYFPWFIANLIKFGVDHTTGTGP